MPTHVQQLQDYWSHIEAGEQLINLQIHQMPPWDDLCRNLNWELYLLDGGSFSEKEHGYCGVYRLIALAAEGKANRPETLSRLCGQDTSGTLYIGMSDSLHKRLNELRRSFNGKGNHGAACALRSISPLASRFSLNKLGIAMHYTAPKATKCVEEHLIQSYANSFGDTPPLNYDLPGVSRW